MIRRLPAACIAALLVCAPAAAAPWQLERSDVFEVRAPDSDSYAVMVAWPEGNPPEGGWPVLWVLDGEDNFVTAVVTARRLSKARARSGVEPGLIVGVASGSLARRSRDYTPAVPGYAIPPGAPGAGLPTGGADAFLAFFAAKIRPGVAARWPFAEGRQTIAGHSFGGLFVLDDLLTSGHFSNYVAISPSLWYGNGKALPKPASLAGKRVLLARAEVERDPAGAMASLASAIRDTGAEVHELVLSGQSHGSTMNASIVQTITFAFGKGDRP